MEGANASEHGRAARRAGRIRSVGQCMPMSRPASGRSCHVQVAFAGEKGVRPLGVPRDRQGIARSRSGQSERSSPYFHWRVQDLRSWSGAGGHGDEERKIILLEGGFARRKIQVFLRQCPLFQPHVLRTTASQSDKGRYFTLEVAVMPAISHSNPPIAGPVFARSGMVRSWARIVVWQNGKGQRQTACGSCSHPPTTCRYTTRQSPILASGNLSACLRDRLPVNSSKPSRSVPPANASSNREAIS